MDINQEKESTVASKKTPPKSDPNKIDSNAPAGTPTSLGAESVRNGRPSTDDSVVEAMDEEFPLLQEAEATIQGNVKKAGEAVIKEHKKN